MTPEQEAIVRKVQKLFALAGRAGSDHEAASAAAQARKIMLDYGLTVLDINSVTSEDCAEQGCKLKENYVPSYAKVLGAAVCKCFSVKCITQTQFNARTFKTNQAFIFVGIIPDVYIASQLFSFLLEYVQNKVRAYKFKGKQATAYKLSFAYIVYKRIIDDANEDAEQENALVLVKDAAATNYLQRVHGELRDGRGIKNTYDPIASHRGTVDGMSVSLDRPIDAAEQPALCAGGAA